MAGDGRQGRVHLRALTKAQQQRRAVFYPNRTHRGPSRGVGNLTQLLRPLERSEPLDPPTVTGVVVHGVVHGRAVVPQHHLAGFPADPDLELGPGLVGVKEREEGIALFAFELLNLGDERRIDVKRPATTARVNARDRVRRCRRRTPLSPVRRA